MNAEKDWEWVGLEKSKEGMWPTQGNQENEEVTHGQSSLLT